MRLAVIVAVIGGWTSLAVAQMRSEPPGLMPPGTAQPQAAVPAAAKQTVPAADEQPEMVVDVRIAGNKSVPLEKILPSLRTRAGRPFDLELINEDVRRLDQTRMFVDVKTYSQRVTGGRVVIFDVLERPLLQDVKYIGCKKISKKTLRKETKLKAGDSLDPFAVEEARRKIEELYHKRGFAGARITIIEGNKPEDRRAIFYINEGKKQRIKSVSFIGNTIADDSRLKTQIQSKPPFLYLFKGELDRKQLDEDVELLTAYYRGLGFFRARIGRELNYNEKKDWASITFVIDEGPRYKIRDVSVIGNKQYSSDELTADLKLRDGEYFNQASMSADIGSLQDKYGCVGYVFAEVKADPRFLEEPGQLDLVYNINEGDRYRVGKINIRIKGDYPHTQLTTVRTRLSFNPGDVIDIREIRASERRLRACGLFESNPAMGQPPKIVFNPPEQGKEEQIADRPKPPSRSKFRGQSPDPAPRERVLDITLDCGRMGNTGRGMAGLPAIEDPDSRLRQATQELTDVLSQRKHRRQPLDRLIHTQYTPNAGRVNPALLPQSSATQSQGVYPNDRNTGETPAPPPASSTTQRAPEYVAQRWPRQGPTRLVDSPEGPYVPGPIFDESSPFVGGPPDGGDTLRTLDFEVLAHEAMTGRMMFGVGVNSDAGMVGQIVLDEQNFDWTRFPRGWEDIRNATAFRGAGQRFRLEAVPGTQLQRYMINFQDPYLFGSNINLGLSGYYYNRSYREWFEQRIGGRVALGYQFAPDLSGSIAYRGAKINITNTIDPTLPDFAEVTGRDLALHGFQVSLARDKRDNAFMATEGHLLEMSAEQVIGSFNYPRVEIDLRRYFTLHERPDGSGRHVLSLASRAGYTGDNTPIYEHFYAGGFSSLRGFEFRGASPHVLSATTGGEVFVGGQFQFLASAEYMFPITADDMIRGVVFCDTGTVEPTINDWSDRYRVAPGFGLRVSVPAMGPAPIALDFAFPVCWEPGDRFEVFSFFVGFGR
ncbi:MAG: BamA/TamA family outer membrane protein, partial [Pirellulales bacterium]|nr:BamA/TamA family outer membrane protein [Pirellulales bacterium]